MNNYIQDFYEEKLSAIEKSSVIPFPKMIIDEWGEFGDSEKNDNNNNINFRPAISAHRYKEFREEYNEYHRTITNFLKQSAEVIKFKLLQLLGNEVNDYSQIARVSLVGNLFELFKHIEPFQKQFRFHFVKFIDPYQLKQLENNEKEAIRSLCFIWHHYLCDGKFIIDKKNIAKLALDKVNETKLTFQSRLKTSLQKLAIEKGFKIRIEFEEENKRCLIITDSSDIFFASEMFQIIYNELSSVIGFPEYTSIKYLQLSANFERFNLIQLYNGRSLNNQWHEFRLYNLRERSFENLEPHSFIPSEIDSDVLKKFELKSWNDVSDEIRNLKKMVDSISIAHQFGFHLIQFSELESDSTEWGKETLDISKINILQKLIENVTEGMKYITIWAEKICDYKFEIITDLERDELIDTIKGCFELIYPNDNYYSIKEFPKSWKFEEIEQWLPRLEKLIINLQVIYLFLSGKIIEKTSRENDYSTAHIAPNFPTL